MQVGDQHRVERAGRRRRRDLAAQVGDARAQDRIGQDAGPAELDQDRRVPEPGDPVAAHGGGSVSRRAARSSVWSASVRAASAEKNATSSPIPTST